MQKKQIKTIKKTKTIKKAANNAEIKKTAGNAVKKGSGKGNTAKKITADVVLAEILEIPGAESILAKYKVPCLSCPMAQFEMQSLKLGDICRMYGIDAKKLLIDLNK